MDNKDKFVTRDLFSAEELDSAEELENKEIEECDLKEGASFACCSLYYECSNARKCINNDAERAKQCAYRQNLESGNIFYGKNATRFNEKKFNEYLMRMNELPFDARKELDYLIMDFCDFHRGSSFLVVRNAHIEELSTLGLFEFGKLDHHLTNAVGYRVLRRVLKTRLPDADQVFSEINRLRKNKTGSEYQKRRDRLEIQAPELVKLIDEFKDNKSKQPELDFFCRWFNGPGSVYRDLIAEPYRIATVCPGADIYLEEIWRDHYFSIRSQFQKRKSPLADDGIK